MNNEILTKAYILDIGMFSDRLDMDIEEFIDEFYESNESYHLRHNIKKAILSSIICKIITEANDGPVYNLNEDTLIRDFDVNSYNYVAYELYENVFRFYDNNEINVDVVIANNSLSVYTYEKSLY